MAKKWTDEQLKAIDTKNRNILVSAAAGSGKTAVLVERIINMITGENSTDIDRLHADAQEGLHPRCHRLPEGAERR